MRARMLNWLCLATALALSGGCVTVPDKGPGINAGSTNSALNPNGTKFSRFWKKQAETLKLDSLAKNKKPAVNRAKDAPPNAEFFLTMAIAQESAGHLDSAEQFYRTALDAEPKSLAALTGYAHFEDRRRHLNAATKLYKRALAKHPEEASVYNDLALCYQRQGMLNESVTALRKATQLQPERALYHNNLATVLVDSEKNDEALEQLLIMNPSSVAHYNLACLLHRKGNDPLAVDHFEKALFDDPKMRPAQQWLAKLGPQVQPGKPGTPEIRFAQQPQPMQVELGPESEEPQVRVDDSAGPIPSQPPAAPQTAARPIPAQAVSRQVVRQRPVIAPIDEAAAASSAEYVQAAEPSVTESYYAAPPAAESQYAPPPVAEQSNAAAPVATNRYTAQPAVEAVAEPQATDSYYAAPPVAESQHTPPAVAEQPYAAPPVEANRYTAQPTVEAVAEAPQASESLYSPPPATELQPAEQPASESFYAPPPGNELGPEGQATDSQYGQPPMTEPLPDAGRAPDALFNPPPATEPLPADEPAATQPAIGEGVQYPQHAVRTEANDGVEMLPVAPLPEAPRRPARPMSQPDEIEPLPAME